MLRRRASETLHSYFITINDQVKEHKRRKKREKAWALPTLWLFYRYKKPSEEIKKREREEGRKRKKNHGHWHYP